MYKLSVKLEYAILAVLSLATHEDAGGAPLSVRAISEKENLSQRFLEQAMNALKERGVIEAIRGPYGGYRLAKPSKEITLSDIVFAIEGVRPLRGKRTDQGHTRTLSSSSSKPKILNQIIAGMGATLESYLIGIDFDHLSRQAQMLQEREALTYSI
ncbi:MAG: Rrf2 family transcriptional regulator [Nitrospirota bacterium]|mgnify:CR=1 FL=1